MRKYVVMGKKLEEMPPFFQQLMNLLGQRTADLLNLIKNKEHALKNAPSGSIRIVRRGKSLQFYKKDGPGDYQGTYMPRQNDYLAHKLVQKDYDERILEKANKELSLIQNFQSAIQKNIVDNVYNSLDENRKSLVNPATLTDSQYAERWQNVSYRKKRIDEGTQKLITDNGDVVRSKSEVIIANALKSNSVPYRYEFPIVISREKCGTENAAWYSDEDYCEFHPDFYCLNLKTRQEYAWEHFGMMDDADYAERAIQKLAMYSANGYFPGKNLIITMESKNTPLSSLEINRIINEYLK